MSAVMGAQIRPLSYRGELVRTRFSSVVSAKRKREAYLVNRTRKAIWASVTDSAAMIRSPSFSRSCESRAMINSPFSAVSQALAILLPKDEFSRNDEKPTTATKIKRITN